MDFALPDENTMELMRREFAKLHAVADAKAAVCSAPPPEAYGGGYITGLLLILYFMGILRYNRGYGTEILNADRGMGRLRPVQCAFGKLNNLV